MTSGANNVVECVLFDLDGTLIDTLGAIRESMRHATAQVLGEPLPDEVLMRNVGVPLAVQMKEFSAEHSGELLLAYREHNDRVDGSLVREYPGVESVLERLATAGVRMAVVTSKLHEGACRDLNRFGLERFFEAVIGSDDVALHKPDPFPLLHTAGLMGVSPHRCAYVGDSPHDMTAATKAGMLAIGVTWGIASQECLERAGAQRIAHSMSEVPGIIEGHTVST